MLSDRDEAVGIACTVCDVQKTNHLIEPDSKERIRLLLVKRAHGVSTGQELQNPNSSGKASLLSHTNRFHPRHGRL